MKIIDKIESLTLGGSSDLWKFNKNILYFKKVAYIPVMKVGNDDVIYIYFSRQVSKEVVKVIKLFYGEKFLLISPIFSAPHLISEDFHKTNIKNYLNNYAERCFYNKFRRIEFDMISNMVNYCNHFDCFYLFKDIYEEVNKEINKVSYDYFSNKKYYKHDEEIRNEFSGIYRQIRINQIIN